MRVVPSGPVTAGAYTDAACRANCGSADEPFSGYAQSVARRYNAAVNSLEAVDITRLLTAWAHGEEQALDQLMPLVYHQLHTQARRYMRGERSDATLQTTALVHELFLRLVGSKELECLDRAHFFALSARMMRRILVDKARARTADKRGGRIARSDHSSAPDLDQIATAESEDAATLCALDDALESLARIDARRARVIELRFFGGLSVEETARALDVSPQTVMRDWRLAKAWLARELSGA